MPKRSQILESLNKDLAKLGDAIVNFIASASLTIFFKKPIGLKVKNTILKQAWLAVYGRAGIRRGLMSPQDLAEAFIAYLWLKEEVNIEDMLKIFARRLFELTPATREEVEEALKLSIEDLLKLGAT